MRPLILLLLVVACAPAQTEGSDATPRQADIYTSAETGTIRADQPRAVTTNVASPPQSVWLAVKKVFADLDVPVTVDNPSSHQVGNSNFFRSRQFAGQSMASFADCGSGMTGPKAATYRIYMSLLIQVDPDGKGGSNVKTTFVPMGQDVAEGSSDRIPCGSTGRLELYVNEQVKATLGKT